MPNLKETLTEFRVGYFGTALLALGFLSLGALIMYASGEEFSVKGIVFAEQFINMYTTSIGKWAYWVISVAAFTTMFSTTITVLDAFSRVLNSILRNFFPKKNFTELEENGMVNIWLGVMIVGATLIIAFAARSMIRMVTIATVLSFLMAPIMAWLNLKVVTDEHMPVYARPGIFLRALSWAGIAFLVIFTLIFLYWQFLAW